MTSHEPTPLLTELAKFPVLVGLSEHSRPALDELRAALRQYPLTAFQQSCLRQHRAAQLLVGPYVLLDKLGEGGMGEVYKARHAKLGRLVAIKLIRPDKLTTSTAAKRFLREVRATAKVDHPRIVRALDADSCQNRHFLVMELVNGIDLARLVVQQGPLTIPNAVQVLFEVALALESLHESGIVHRDLKPTNLMLEHQTGQVKLLDLGLSRIVHSETDNGEASEALTMAGAIIGTPDYMAPEQCQNAAAADIRSDLYSLACVLYFLLTGQVPYPGGTAISKMTRQMTEPFPDVRALRPNVPPGLVAILRKLVAKSPAKRYQTPAQLIADVAEFKSQPTELGEALAQESDSSATHGTMVIPVQAASEVAAEQMPTQLSDFSRMVNPASTVTAAAPRTTTPRRQFPKLLLLSVAMTLISTLGLAAVIVMLVLRRPAEPAMATTRPATDTPDELKPFRDRLARRGVDYDQLRDDLIQAGEAAFGTPKAAGYFNLLKQLPNAALSDLGRPANDEAPVQWLGDPRRQRTHKIRVIAVSPDGQMVALVEEHSNAVHLLEPRSGQPLGPPLIGHETAVEHVQFSPDGQKLLACSRFHTLQGQNAGLERQLVVWDLSTRNELLKLNHDRGGWAIAGSFTPDSQTVFVGHYDKARLWDLATGKMVREFRTDGMDWSGAVEVSPDGQYAVTGGNYEKQFRVWNLQTGQLLHELPGHVKSAQAVAIHPTQPLVATLARDHCVRIWELTTGKLVRKIPFVPSATSMTWTLDGQALLVGYMNFEVRAYPLDDKNKLRSIWTSSPVRSLAVCPKTGHLYTAGDGGRVEIWNTATGQAINPPELNGSIHHAAFQRDGQQIVVYAERGAGTTFDLRTGERLKTRPHLETEVYLKAIQPDGQHALIVPKEKWQCKTWNHATGELADAPRLNIKRAAMSWAGQRLLWTPEHHGSLVICTELPSGKQRHEFPADLGDCEQLACSYDGKLGAYQTGSEIRIVNLEDGKIVRSVKLPTEDPVEQLRFCPDNSRLFVAGPQSRLTMIPLQPVQKNPLTYGRPVTTDEPISWCGRLACSPDSELLALGSFSGEILVRPITGSGRVRRFKAGQWPISSLSFSLDGRLLAAGLQNGHLAIFKLN